MSKENESLTIQEEMNNSVLSEDDNQSAADKEETDFKFKVCKYCKGIIPRSYRRTPTSHCSKICFETNKVVPSEFYFPDTGKTEIRGTFSIEKDFCYYREVLKDKAALSSAFTQLTQNASTLETGMKLECLDLNNPVNYCVATVIKISGHRLCLRYDGYGQDSSNDFWCNFQAEELFPIGWCAQKGYHLQPPTGISCSHNEWKEFLSRTLNGALAAPSDLFKKSDIRRQLRCHSYLPGEKVEAIHPERPDLIVPSVITKSLGPYYFLVTTDALSSVPSATFYGYADCPGIYSSGWCASRGLELEIPTVSSVKEIRMIRKADYVVDSSNHGGKRNRTNTFKPAQKVEVLDKDVVRVATVAEIFGRVALLVFDGLNKLKFIDKNSLDVYPVGWSENTKSVLYTPYGPVDFSTNSPVIGIKPKTSASNEVHSASFTSFKQSLISSPIKDDKPLLQHTLDQNTEIEPMDIDVEPPSSPLSPTNLPGYETKKSDVDKFIVWLLNKYECTRDGNQAIVKSDLVDAYSNLSSTRLSPRWFTLLYKLFPGVVTIRRNIDGRFVNCLKHLKESKHDKMGGPIYVKDAVEYLNTEQFLVQLGKDKLVTFLGLGNNYKLPEDSREIFTTSKALEHSNVFVMACDINVDDYTLSNFVFHFEQTPCLPPLPKISSIDQFRAAFKLCKLANICNGIDYQPNIPQHRQGSKVIRGGRVYSMACNLVAFPHKGELCIHCKNLRGKCNSNLASSQDAINKILDDISDDIDECGMSKDEEEHNPALELKIFFNKTCYPGIYLNPDKVVQIAPHTQQDKPVQALKYLIERLIEISNSKEKLSSILENGFGTRIFNKSRDKIVKKGLFQFNTKSKVLRFMKRLVKRLSCCESFLTLEPMECQHNCKGNSPKKKTREHGEGSDMMMMMSPTHRVTSPIAVQTNAPSSMQHQAGNIGNKMTPGLISTAQGNMQVLYQLPPGTTNAHHPANAPHLLLQNQDLNKNPHHNKFSQGTQFFLPPNSGNVTYMVVPNNKEKMSGVQIPVTGNIQPNHQGSHILTSPPPSGVSQMMANVSKTNLVTDIDNPNKNSPNKPKISVVKSVQPNQNQQIWMKRGGGMSDRFEHQQQQQQQQQQHHHQMRMSIDNINTTPTNYHDSPRLSHNSTAKYPQIQSVASYADPMRTQYETSSRPVVQSGEKGQKIHVHKVHHGNARVKYVEFKPFQDRNNMSNLQQQHPYNQAVYYHNSSNNSAAQQQHIMVHTPGQSPKSPLHSPPALRPPPSGPPRSVALHSPPSLVPSPEVRPRFEFVGNRSSGSPVNTNSPSQVTNIMNPKHQQKTLNATAGHQTINIPRIPSIPVHQKSDNSSHPKVLHQTTRVFQSQDGSPLQGKPIMVSSPNITGSSSTTSAVTVNMAYIPIQTSANNKIVYVPVNSLQTGQGQPVVLYQNQTLKDSNGKPVILSPQMIQGNKSIRVVSKPSDMNHNKDNTSSFTTVRIQQGIPQSTAVLKSPVAVHTPSNMKTLRYQFGQNSPGFSMHNQHGVIPVASDNDNHKTFQNESRNSFKEEFREQPIKYEEFREQPIKHEEFREQPIKLEECATDQQSIGKMKTEPISSTHNQPTPSGAKRKISPPSNQQTSATSRVDENATPDNPKLKKKRGRPPAAMKTSGSGTKGPRSKLTMMQGNPLPPSTTCNPLTLANRVLTEAFYRKQQQAQNRINYLREPLLQTPGLPSNPEMWTADDVYKFLSQTDCAQYADSLKDEEMDGKSFLLLTREALMEFKGFRLGPALKIVGYAAYLRAKNTMQNTTSPAPSSSNGNNNNNNNNNNNHVTTPIPNNSLDTLSTNDTTKSSSVGTNSIEVGMETVSDAVQMKELWKDRLTVKKTNHNDANSGCHDNSINIPAPNQNKIDETKNGEIANEVNMNKNHQTNSEGESVSSNVTSTTIGDQKDGGDNNTLKLLRTSDSLPIEVLTSVNSNS